MAADDTRCLALEVTSFWLADQQHVDIDFDLDTSTNRPADGGACDGS